MKYTKLGINKLKLHVLWWAIFITYETLIVVIVGHNAAHFLYYAFFYTLHIALFYTQANLIMPLALKRPGRSVFVLPLLLLVEMVIYLAVVIALTILLDVIGVRKLPLEFDKRFFLGAFWRGITFILYGTGYYYVRTYIEKQRFAHEKAMELEQVRFDLAMIEKDFLRAQINPHLLFNTLNFIKYAAKKHPEQVEKAIFSLSELMRFALDRENGNEITLQQELDQIDNIIQLNQMRYNGLLFVKYRCAVKDRKVKIIPVVLLTLIENIFKHGNLTDRQDPAEIHLYADSDRLELTTTNLIANTLQGSREPTGLQNIAARLVIAYPGRHELSFERNGRHFHTKLILILSPNDDLSNLK